MSMLMRMGNNMASLSPMGIQGMMLGAGGFAQGRRAEWDAMNRQLGHLTGAFDAHRQGQMDRRGGYQRANEAIFGPGPGSASSQLQDAIRDVGSLATDRSSDLAGMMERAQEAFAQEDALRSRGTREPGAGGAFEQAMAHSRGADAARASGREAGMLGEEGLADAMRGMQERYGEGLHGAGLAGMRAGMERDIGAIRGGAQDTVSGIRQWQAGQERPQFSPMGMFARAFGPAMMRQGLAQGRATRAGLLGGYGGMM